MYLFFTSLLGLYLFFRLFVSSHPHVAQAVVRLSSHLPEPPHASCTALSNKTENINLAAGIRMRDWLLA